MAITVALDGPVVVDDIETALLKTLQDSSTQSDNIFFVFSAKDEHERLVGGLTASTSYGWLLIKALWVHEEHRENGIGKSLMNEAEKKALDIGCHSAWLDTSNPKAKRFYDSLGYATFGELANGPGRYPHSHRRWFMKKRLR